MDDRRYEMSEARYRLANSTGQVLPQPFRRQSIQRAPGIQIHAANGPSIGECQVQNDQVTAATPSQCLVRRCPKHVEYRLYCPICGSL